MPQIESIHIYVSGKVQGVGYRDFTQRRAADLQLKGYARNLADGRVEIEVEGERAKIEELVQSLRQGPPRSKVTAVDISWGPSSNRFHAFSIRS
ncbi:acylphosphatase [Candidatus Manganitrophus noduliformans]|uniref:acylphosphatase n=1 Tax=Candidatus Manganitrophus noduliformans TaxID=2606439 RepID=A0A7X6IAU6_9BACT|nr:acylphosphatase [Candidatus Manganitrophus noduliformans]NKE70943.1 acylphosphatase [Candidatus Manganitrophus noduliformans]